MSDDVNQDDLNSADPRTAAIARLHVKRNLRRQAVIFVVLSIFFVAIWLISDRGFFWPIFPIAGLAIAWFSQAWTLYGNKAITEGDIQREIEKGR
jgi:hypothetical protein